MNDIKSSGEGLNFSQLINNIPENHFIIDKQNRVISKNVINKSNSYYIDGYINCINSETPLQTSDCKKCTLNKLIKYTFETGKNIEDGICKIKSSENEVIVEKKYLVCTKFIDKEKIFVHLKQIDTDLDNNNLATKYHNKNKIFSIIAHDLKSPFNTMIGYTELLKKKSHVYSPEKISLIAEKLNLIALNTFNLLENLLLWTNFHENRIKICKENLNFIEIINPTIVFFRELIDSKQISIKIDDAESTIFADKIMLQYVLRNLIHNAIKFTENNGTVIIKISKNRKNIIISVIDDGIGISENTLANIFDNNILTTTQGTNYEKGTGLGLQLCKEFIELHNGKLWVESKKGEGSKFCFSIPDY